MYYFYLAFALLSIVVFRFINFQQPIPILGIYTKPGKWYYLKFALFYSLLKFRKVMNSMRQNATSKGEAGYGIKSRSTLAAMDCAQPLSDDPKAIDAVYFNAASKDGCYLVGGTARRPQGVVNGFLYLKVPAVGLLLTPKLPDTTLFQSQLEKENSVFGADGLRFEPLEPMKRWRLTYNGQMK
ncbi:hypothetical protein B566_EDAN005072 [Ephemera danica]|nr:hypothetical protein B566_EDAN005072 [Ephemera danica]